MSNPVFDQQKPDFRFEEDDAGSDDLQPISVAVAPSTSRNSDQGPCLYLGPAGQRCYQRAIKGGFCALHQPGAAAKAKIAKRSKWLAAIAGILGVLWPYVYAFVRELLRLIHPR